MDFKMGSMKVSTRWGRGALALAIALGAGAGSPARAEAKLETSGYAWTQAMSGLTPMYKGEANFDYNPFIEFGGQLFLGSQPAEHWRLDMSLGVVYLNNAIKKTLKDDSGSVISTTNPNSFSLGMNAYLYEANLAYKTGNYTLKVGKFHYVYSDYNTDLGLYLLRGPVYPGFLYGGFHDIPALTKTGILSSWSPMESLRWDVIASFETDFKPYMDLNLSSFLTYTAGMFEIGAGFESQRLVELNPCITSPSGRDVDVCLGGDASPVYVNDTADLYKGAFYVIDSAGRAPGAYDTTRYSLAGTKAMVRGALDFKKAIPGYEGGAKDMVLYFELALLGVKDYPHIYEKKGERMPVLVGFNVPTFGFLDRLSVEVEYYDAPFQNDPYKLVGTYDVFHFADGNSINYSMSPIPPSNKAGEGGHLFKAQEDFDPKKDNLKWSIYLLKTIANNIRIKAQIASDHWRVPNNNFVLYEAAANPGQFTGSLRLEYSL
jgi:hypothetical protein